MHKERIKILRQAKLSKNPVIYWMSRDQRADDNWALLYAQNLALELEVPLTFSIVILLLDVLNQPTPTSKTNTFSCALMLSNCPEPTIF